MRHQILLPQKKKLKDKGLIRLAFAFNNEKLKCRRCCLVYSATTIILYNVPGAVNKFGEMPDKSISTWEMFVANKDLLF